MVFRPLHPIRAATVQVKGAPRPGSATRRPRPSLRPAWPGLYAIAEFFV
jgi:hypothetical protein